MIRRREFITLLGVAAATWPLAARAQQPAVPVIGYLHVGTSEAMAGYVMAFRKGLAEAGYVEGRNVAVEYRWANNEFNRLPELAADLVRRKVAVIAALGTVAAATAAKGLTTTIPIVFQFVVDPVQAGLVASFNRPGGNVTGVTNFNQEFLAKQFDLLHELLPGAKRFAVLINVSTPFTEGAVTELPHAAAALGLPPVEVIRAGTISEIDAAFAILLEKKIEGLIINPNTLFTSRRVQLVTLAARHAMPTSYPYRDFTDIGGLMSYGANNPDQHRQVGIYVGRILKGEKPEGLPVLRPTKFELVINLGTAKTIGLTIPSTLLAIADEIIE
jgi:putative ABC transport system substrate-binding protein